MEEYLENLLKDKRELIAEGKVADYIPALAQADKDKLAIALINEEGELFKAGDYEEKFTIQSISKVGTLLLAILDRGRDEVFSVLDYEGSSEPFNSLYQLDLAMDRRPPNPMVNAGAILATSKVKGQGEEAFERILDLFKLMTANESLTYNEEVYLSEKESGDRNRALAYLLKSKGLLQGQVDQVLDTYFKQCSIDVNVVDLARMADFIDRGFPGLDFPEALDRQEARKILLGIMAMSGLYNSSGRHMVDVGIPCKSGVAGGLMGLAAGKMTIGTYSPGLDENGNSLVGLAMFEDLSRSLDLHIFK